MWVRIDPKVKQNFPNLHILAVLIKDLRVRRWDPQLEVLKAEVIREIRSQYNVKILKDYPSVRTYRDFFWKIGIDPTKNRPAAEALIRRILLGNPLPRINTFVDSLNLASIRSEIAIASFDAEKIIGESLTIRYAVKDEKFYGIGMRRPVLLQGGEVVVSDEEGVIAVYPHRDSERTKITESTKSTLLIFCGVPGISFDKLIRAMNIATDLITRFCGGSLMNVKGE